MCNRGNGFFLSGQELTMSREWSLALSGRFFPMQPLFQQSGTFRRNRCNRLSIAVLIGLLMKTRLEDGDSKNFPIVWYMLNIYIFVELKLPLTCTGKKHAGLEIQSETASLGYHLGFIQNPVISMDIRSRFPDAANISAGAWCGVQFTKESLCGRNRIKLLLYICYSQERIKTPAQRLRCSSV